MKLETTQDIEKLLRMYLASAAVTTALELKLFWQLAENPLTAEMVSQKFNIPALRCQSWLDLLTELGLLQQEAEYYSPSSITHNTILKTYTSESWAFLAQETREGYQTINNLKSTISHPMSVWEAQELENPNYITKMTEDPKRAERFTRLLYELHRSLAEKVVNLLDMTNVQRMMDLGGGSGVISLALLKRHTNLNAVVVDIENVCKVGRQIANETPIANRISFHAANFVLDYLPDGFDLILECDVGVYQKELFGKLRDSLNNGGRFVIISNTNEQGAWISHSDSKPSLFWHLNAFLASLEDSNHRSSTIEEIKALLIEVGFQNVLSQVVDDGFVLIQAIK